MLSSTVEKFKRLTKHPERYLQAQDDVAEEIKNLLKTVYDFTKNQEGSVISKFALPELVIKDFDDEQIWQELELQNSTKHDKFISDVSRLLASRNRLYFPFANERNDLGENNNDDIERDYFETNEDQEVNNKGSNEEKQTSDTNGKATRKLKIKPSVVDDQFFKLSQLEDFLNKEDKKENRSDKSKTTDVRDNAEDYLDLFEDIPSDENEEDGRVHYDEFFDAPEDEDAVQINCKRKRCQTDDMGEIGGDNDDEDLSDGHDDGNDMLSDGTPVTKNEKQVRFDLAPASSTDSKSEASGDDDDDEQNGTKFEDNKPKSSFELRQERLQERIRTLEEKALQEKSWQMRGEVMAANRPQNSLLEEVLEFDMTARPAPVMTEQTTLKLEDIIRQRIKDKSWDDVERKVKPTMAPDEYKKKLVLNQEKSKLSLAEIYEQEYLKQKEAQDPDAEEKPEEEPQEHRTIRAMTSALFAKLDALTNFHYTPKPAIPETKVVTNLPAITMEEVAPIGTSDATLLAPEEVKAKQKGELMGKEERTKTDKKRERRKKKKMQGMKEKEKEQREKTIQKLNLGLGNKYSKERAMNTLKKLSSDKNVHQLGDEGKDKGLRSSTAFFNRLQDEVIGHVKGKTNETKRKEKEKFSAKKIKL